MIEIIKEGYYKGNIDIRYNNICPLCHCEYTYQTSDVQTDLTGNFISCPCCGSKNLSAHLIPTPFEYDWRRHITCMYDSVGEMENKLWEGQLTLWEK